MDRYFNPFQSMDILVPVEFHDALSRYSQHGGSDHDQSPFPRMVDFWFVSICVAARLKLEPVESKKRETRKIIDGSILGSDPWRIHVLMLLAIGLKDDVQIVSDPRKMMSIANGMAVAGFPRIIEMIREGGGEAIWNLSDAIDELL